MLLFTKCFVGGSVTKEVDGVEECAADAEVVVMHNGTEVGRARTDTFGEFKIDKLAPHSAGYELEVSAGAGRTSATFDRADNSLYLCVLQLGV